jgi:6-phosphogluconolactonase
MQTMVTLQEFASRETASRAAAGLLAARLREDLEHGTHASLVVSGGSTPGTCFDLLSRALLGWARVTVVPSDERWVPAADPNSNEGLIRRTLLQNAAAAARLLPLYRPGLDPALAPAAVEGDLRELTQPFSAVLLGIGADGHFASLFPDFAGLARALAPAADERCTLVKPAGSPLLRISLTLSALLRTAQVGLLFFGTDKRAVFEQALAGAGGLPLASLLAQPAVPVTALWAA